jgi:hypothetical protein
MDSNSKHNHPNPPLNNDLQINDSYTSSVSILSENPSKPIESSSRHSVFNNSEEERKLFDRRSFGKDGD